MAQAERMRRFDQINVIPFIDIMLVLLAIVLTTATFIAQGKLDINLPEAEQQTPRVTEPQIEIAIDRQQNLLLDGQPTDLGRLAERLAAVDRTTRVSLRVDSEVYFARFVEVVDLLKANRLERVAILTREKR
jgi:biopolymer transport protein ExbD